MKTKNRRLTITITYLILLAFVLPLNIRGIKSYPFDTYPTNGWQTATPEEVGINSTLLDKMHQFILKYEEVCIDSVSIVKNGYLCYEKYYEYYNYSDLHLSHSVTKSIISALIGIANDTGFIPNLDEPIVEIFSNRTIQNRDARKEAMTIRHLLEHRSGLDTNDVSATFWSETIAYNDFTFRTNETNVHPGTWLNYLHPENDFYRLMNSSDWIQFALDKPMATEPGTEWSYSDCNTHLLSAVIREKTGMNTETYAKQVLFDPLNITDYLWWQDPSGLSMGADGLWLTPHDMLKFGYLYLKNGEWNNTQIVPAEWVETSTKNIFGNRNYGYQWWLDPEEKYYYADGLGGQHIIVTSEEDLVVVLTAWQVPAYPSLTVFNKHILGAIIPEETSTTTTTTTTTTPEGMNSLSLFLGLIVLIGYSLLKKRKT